MTDFSPIFQAIDAFTAKQEGGKTLNDGTGHAAAYGIDQNAHPNINVMALTPQQAQTIRHNEYWRAINGDMLAEIDPKLALVAYDTAIMSGPGRAKQLIRQSDGDVAKMMQLRVGYQRELVANHPEKYANVEKGWENRNEKLATAIGQPIDVQPQQASQQPVQTAALTPPPEPPKAEPPKQPESPPEEQAKQPIRSSAPPLAPAPPPTSSLVPSTQEAYQQLLGQPAKTA